jgi:hypothetical protein
MRAIKNPAEAGVIHIDITYSVISYPSLSR